MFNFLLISLILFFLAIWGICVTRKNLIIVLICLEIILLSVSFNFIIFSVFLDDLIGQIFSLFILTVAAAESAIGLAILVVYYRLNGFISLDLINLIKG
jgi:NADH-quinone oxidoreductase subunit K